MRCLGRLSRRSIALIQVAVGLGTFTLGVAIAGLPATAQSEGDAGSVAQITSMGWWERKPNFPNVPANATAVAAENGNASKITALGINVQIGADETFSSLRLTLKEATDTGANFPPITDQSQSQQQTAVLVVACPVTSIYTPADGGDINSGAPVYDCLLARGDGQRAADGTWTFDLSSLAELWTSNGLEQKGIVLVEWVPSPGLTFQVAYQDLATGTPKLNLETEFSEEAFEEDTETSVEEETFEDTTSTDTGGNFFAEVADSSDAGTADSPFGIVEPTTTTTAPSAPTEPAPETPIVSNRQPTKGSLPVSMALLLPLALGAALLCGIVLGPQGDPAATVKREGGLSRALAGRAAAGSAATHQP